MRIELKGFQEEAARRLASDMAVARGAYYRDGSPACCCLSAPTGSGKTVMAGAVIEGFLEGSEDLGIERDPAATFLWVSNSPSLNQQTREKFEEGCDIDPQLYVTIDNAFTGPIEPNRVYFLNQQLLGRDKVLTRGGERPTFWSILDHAIEDADIHLYMMLDEAHVGIGQFKPKDEDEKGDDGRTIYDRLIDGHDIHRPLPMPVVVGISATLGRFVRLMSGRDRTSRPPVTVSPAAVQASGLLKDNIIVSVPDEGAAVEGMYLKSACRSLVTSTAMWKLYEERNPGSHVVPLMVVQVKNGAKPEDDLLPLCRRISAYTDSLSLDPKTSFAHVFGSGGDISVGGYEIPKVNPEDVQRKEDIRVLFAKEAISTGWDCPRAEVLYSMRPHRDDEYIAQLIGRMVRTPLAHAVDMGVLNSVTCYLPCFDSTSVDKVVTRLTTEDSDEYSGITEQHGRTITRKPVEATWDDTLDVTSTSHYRDMPERRADDDASSGEERTSEKALPPDDQTIMHDGYVKPTKSAQPRHASKSVDVDTCLDLRVPHSVREAFASIGMLARAQHGHLDWVHGGYELATFLANNGMSTTANDELTSSLEARLETAIATYQDEFRQRRNHLSHIPSTLIAFQYLNPSSVKRNKVTDDADEYALENVVRHAKKVFDIKVVQEYSRRKVSGGESALDINLDLAAAVATPEIRGEVVSQAELQTKQMMKTYADAIRSKPDSVRQTYDGLMNRYGIPHTVYMSMPENMMQDKASCKEGYPKHILNDPSTHLAYFKLDKLEERVIRNEVKRSTTLAWYRNPPSGNPERSLTIDYRGLGPGKSCHPDFIIFDSVNGAVLPSVIDPHGLWIGDALAKLKGVVRHLERYGAQYHRFWSLDDVDDQIIYLDLFEQPVQEAVKASMDAREIFKHYGRDYPFV